MSKKSGKDLYNSEIDTSPTIWIDCYKERPIEEGSEEKELVEDGHWTITADQRTSDHHNIVVTAPCGTEVWLNKHEALALAKALVEMTKHVKG